HTNIGILAKAITRLEENQFSPRLDGATRSMMENIAPRMPFGRKLVMANLWLFGPVVRSAMVKDRGSAPMVRSTTAATMINAGVKDNVLPIDAAAVVNFRIMPGESVEGVRNHIIEVIDDERITVAAASVENEPSPVSDPSSAAFRMIENTIHQIFPEDVLVTPYLVVGGTDAKHYSGRSQNVYRFLPVYMTPDGMTRFHGTNERMSLENLEISVRYFYQLITNMQEL
ncbi:MAG: M20/M25/M40 family metallo-hydrolase, partial [Gemmatimonadota bacterium]|nr:M20/M25/M40 family metallo-hydrolase [Gemmatimonadota bacterium]